MRFFQLLLFVTITLGCSKDENVFDQPSHLSIYKKTSDVISSNDIQSISISASSLMSYYSTGFQTAYELRHSGAPTSFPSFTTKVQINNLDKFNEGYTSVPIDLKSRGPLGTGGATETYSINTGNNYWFQISQSTSNDKLYIWYESTYQSYNSVLESFMNTYNTNEWYDIAARLGFYDGLGASSPYAVTSVIYMDGNTYVLPWPTNCPGCQPF